jgi:hypothetical protein
MWIVAYWGVVRFVVLVMVSRADVRVRAGCGAAHAAARSVVGGCRRWGVEFLKLLSVLCGFCLLGTRHRGSLGSLGLGCTRAHYPTDGTHMRCAPTGPSWFRVLQPRAFWLEYTLAHKNRCDTRRGESGEPPSLGHRRSIALLHEIAGHAFMADAVHATRLARTSADPDAARFSLALDWHRRWRRQDRAAPSTDGSRGGRGDVLWVWRRHGRRGNRAAPLSQPRRWLV